MKRKCTKITEKEISKLNLASQKVLLEHRRIVQKQKYDFVLGLIQPIQKPLIGLVIFVISLVVSALIYFVCPDCQTTQTLLKTITMFFK